MPSVEVEDAIVVDEHPAPESLFALSLNLDVNEHPDLAPIVQIDLDQLVGQSATDCSAGGDLLQFRIQKHEAARPIYGRVNVRKEEGHKVWKETDEDVFPRRIIILPRRLILFGRRGTGDLHFFCVSISRRLRRSTLPTALLGNDGT